MAVSVDSLSLFTADNASVLHLVKFLLSYYPSESMCVRCVCLLQCIMYYFYYVQDDSVEGCHISIHNNSMGTPLDVSHSSDESSHSVKDADGFTIPRWYYKLIWFCLLISNCYKYHIFKCINYTWKVSYEQLNVLYYQLVNPYTLKISLYWDQASY